MKYDAYWPALKAEIPPIQIKYHRLEKISEIFNGFHKYFDSVGPPRRDLCHLTYFKVPDAQF